MDKVVEILRRFRDERDWYKFHSPKNLAISISIESGELLELFQWTDENSKIDDLMQQRISDEASDVLIYILLMFDRMGLDPEEEVLKKIEKNSARFPADKFHGRVRQKW